MVSTSAHEFRQLVKKNYAELQVKSPKLPLNLIRIIAVEQAIAVCLDAHLLDPADPHPQYIAPNEVAGAVAAAVSALPASSIPNLPASKITSGILADSLIPSSIARDSEVVSAIEQAIATHLNQADPHPQYTTSDELSVAIAGAISTASNALTAHVNAADPHTQYIDATELAQAIAKITLQSLGAASATHTHTPASIGAAAAVHAHPASAITDFATAVDARITALRNEPQRGATKPTTRADGSALQAGDRWWSTTDNMWFFWNTALSPAVWMSETQHTAPNLGTNSGLFPIKASGLNIYIEEYAIAGRTGLINSSIANIQIQLERCSATADVVLATLTTGAIAANTRFQLSTTLNLLLDVSVLNLTSLRTTANTLLNASALVSSVAQITYRWVKP